MTGCLHDEIKALAKKILNFDKKFTEMSKCIDNGDTNEFFISMLGKGNMLNAKVIHSLQTAFGMSFYEQTCVVLAKKAGFFAKRQHKITGEINEEVILYLNQLLQKDDYTPNREDEFAQVDRLIDATDQGTGYPDSTVDVFIKKSDGTEIYIDITTVKPNKKEFRALKEKILRWYAMRRSVDNTVKIHPYFAIPYNPECKESNDYSRWNAYYDRKDILVGDELWKTVSGGSFGIKDMRLIFDEIGQEIREELIDKF